MKGFIIKEFYHIFRDFRTLIILFGIPVVQLMLFGFVVTNEIKDAKIAIYDQSKDQVTQKITQKLLSSGYFLLDKNIKNYSEIESCFKEGNIKEVIVFESDFARKLEKEGKANVQLIADASDPNTANLLVNYTRAIINNYVAEMAPQAKIPLQIIPQVRMQYNPNLKGVFMFVPGIMAMLLMLISAMLTSISITREKELGTMEILLVSPLRPIQIIVGKVLPYVLLSFVNAVIILLIGNFIFEVPIQGSIILLLAESVLFIMVALSLGILISTLTNSQQVAMMISLVALMLPTILLSGFIFPIENMPVILQALCQFMPPKWFITIIKSIMLKGVGLSYIWKETLVMVIMMSVFILLSVRKFKVRLE
ncbi:MAG TPA: ABC transporter permease [Bacteroidales bacterium]|nr:ABC transporter permease [Bacteroidales bacterium]HPT04340.1 ABC transporter permease [Bacteroidales bacterium]